MILSGKKARARIVVTLEDGREETFSGNCQLSPSLSHSKTNIDIIETHSNGSNFGSKLETDLESLEARSRLLNSLNQAVSKANSPFQINPVSLGFNSILPKFHITDPKIEMPPKTPEPKIREITPDSSPEIIVDKLTPETNYDDVEPKDDHVLNTTPTRPRGPKKNFLARQAALDATLNVLRLRAEKSKTEDEIPHSEKKENIQKSNSISLEMSDNELIENHIEPSSPP